MSLLPAFIHARKRNDDSAPKTETATATATASDSSQTDSRENELDDNIFDLLPPKSEESETAAPEPKPQGRNRHPVDMTDLSRLSIDRDGRLYWDGKPVETHHRLSMSRAQIIGASVITAFVVIGAITSAIQGAVAARNLACQFGWSISSCATPPAPRRPDIPA